MMGINWFSLAGRTAKSAWAGMGGTARAAALGGLAGGIYGAMSSNTSVLGGAMMGAGLAAGGYRYGYRPAVAVSRLPLTSQIGLGMTGTWRKAYGSAIGRAIRSDVRGMKLASNRAFNHIGSAMKGWTAAGFMASGAGFPRAFV